MASEQIMSKAITRAVAEATIVALQTMAEAQAESMHDGSGPKSRQSCHEATDMFNWTVQDKYSELKTFSLRSQQYYFNLQHPTSRQTGSSQKLVR